MKASGKLTTLKKGKLLGIYVLQADDTNSYPVWKNTHEYYLLRSQNTDVQGIGRWNVARKLETGEYKVPILFSDKEANSPFDPSLTWQYYDKIGGQKSLQDAESFNISISEKGGKVLRLCKVHSALVCMV